MVTTKDLKKWAVQSAIARAGGIARLSDLLGVGYSTVASWIWNAEIPPKHLIRLPKITGLSLAQLQGEDLIEAHQGANK